MDKYLNIIYKNLISGNKYGYKVENVRYPYFHTCLVLSDDCKYWCWNNYGSSANIANKKELLWIITTIFELSPIEFVKKYDCINCEY